MQSYSNNLGEKNLLIICREENNKNPRMAQNYQSPFPQPQTSKFIRKRIDLLIREGVWRWGWGPGVGEKFTSEERFRRGKRNCRWNSSFRARLRCRATFPSGPHPHPAQRTFLPPSVLQSFVPLCPKQVNSVSFSINAKPQTVSNLH